MSVVSALLPAAGVGPHAPVPLHPLVSNPLVPHQHGAASVVGQGVRLPVRPTNFTVKTEGSRRGHLSSEHHGSPMP